VRPDAGVEVLNSVDNGRGARLGIVNDMARGKRREVKECFDDGAWIFALPDALNLRNRPRDIPVALRSVTSALLSFVPQQVHGLRS
jgi:hypothetical protein